MAQIDTTGEYSVCAAFGAIVGEEIRRGIRCDDAEAAYPLELAILAGLRPTVETITLWLLRGDRRIQLWPYPGRGG